MAGRARHRCTAGGAVLLPFVGVWLGHSAEYWRVHGVDGLSSGVVGSVHGYMLAAGALLSLLAAVAGVRGLQAWQTLGRRLRAARDAVASAGRGRPVAAAPPERGGASLGSGSLLCWLAPVQVALYVVQENVEAWRAGAPAPGMTAVTGLHWAAPLVHVAVAAWLAIAVVVIHRVLGRRRSAVAAWQRLARVLVTALRRAESALLPRFAAIPSPLDRWQVQLFRRPPPAASLAP